MSPAPQENMAPMPHTVEGDTQAVKHGSLSPQPANGPPLPDNACVPGIAASSSKVGDMPHSQEAQISNMAVSPENMDIDSGNFAAQIPTMAVGPETVDTDSGNLASQIASGPDVGSKKTLESNSEQDMPVVAAPTAEGAKHLGEQRDMGKEPSQSFHDKQLAMLEASERLSKECEKLEVRAGGPSEEPTDKARLPVLKRKLQRIDTALDRNETLDDINLAEDMKIAQDTMPTSTPRLQSSSSTKPASSMKNNTTQKAAGRTCAPGNTGGSNKRRKLNQAPKKPTEPGDPTLTHTMQRINESRAAAEKRNDKKLLGDLRGISSSRSAERKKLVAAAERSADDPTKIKCIKLDIEALVISAKHYGKTCMLITPERAEGGPPEHIYLDDYAWSIKGMTPVLKHHQMVAAGTMIHFENSGECRGGLVFDWMGYGKTVEALALINGKRAPKVKKTPGAATTLVVVPPAVVKQWVDEVKRHCPDLLVSPWTRKADERVLLRSDILVVSYAELRMAYKTAGGTRSGRTRKDRKEHVDGGLNEPLFDTVFYRIILDEIHEIKGLKNLTFDAVMALKAEHRWGLSGTPTPNGAEELYPYLKFIRHPKVSTLRNFKDEYVGGEGRRAIPDAERSKRLHTLLLPVMIRRTPSNTFLGATLLKLPPSRSLPPIKVQFSAEERIIYLSISGNIKGHIMKKAATKKGKVGFRILNESLIRSRQCVTSPLLLENLAMEGFWSAETLSRMRQEVRDEGIQSTPFIDQIERWTQKHGRLQSSTPCGLDAIPKPIANAMALLDNATCPGHGCGKPTMQLEDPQMAECGHAWCKTCFEMQINIEIQCKKHKIPECSRCHKPLGQAVPVPLAEAVGEAAEPICQNTTERRRPGDDYNGKQPREASPTNIMNYLDRNPTAKVPRSAKVRAVIDQVVEWQKEAPEDKIIGTFIVRCMFRGSLAANSKTSLHPMG